jgi:hypothetical protein
MDTSLLLSSSFNSPIDSFDIYQGPFKYIYSKYLHSFQYLVYHKLKESHFSAVYFIHSLKLQWYIVELSPLKFIVN